MVCFVCRAEDAPDLLPIVGTAGEPSIAQCELLCCSVKSSQTNATLKDENIFPASRSYCVLEHVRRQPRREKFSHIAVARRERARGGVKVDANGLLKSLSCFVRDHVVASEPQWLQFGRFPCRAETARPVYTYQVLEVFNIPVFPYIFE